MQHINKSKIIKKVLILCHNILLKLNANVKGHDRISKGWVSPFMNDSYLVLFCQIHQPNVQRMQHFIE